MFIVKHMSDCSSPAELVTGNTMLPQHATRLVCRSMQPADDFEAVVIDESCHALQAVGDASEGSKIALAM